MKPQREFQWRVNMQPIGSKPHSQMNPVHIAAQAVRGDRKARRRQEAAARLEVWRQLTPEQQLKALRQRPGNSARQIAKIKKRTTAGAPVAKAS